MRRLTALLVATAAAVPVLIAGAPAQASVNCPPRYGIALTGRPPFCGVWCAMTLNLNDPCWIQD